jgi:hypothetical protein
LFCLSRPILDERIPDLIFLRLIQPSLQLFYKESEKITYEIEILYGRIYSFKGFARVIWKQKTFVNWKLSLYFYLFFFWLFFFTRLKLSWLRLSMCSQEEPTESSSQMFLSDEADSMRILSLFSMCSRVQIILISFSLLSIGSDVRY